MKLDKIKNSTFLKTYSVKELERLASSIRTELINIIADKGGHLSSNLGVVELTIAIHTHFDLENDKLVMDIGHQSYTHKILTGRYNELKSSLRQFAGLSGYQKFSESEYDHFEAGHAATALAAASGMLKAKELNKQNYKVIALVGDGGIASGLSFEALNNLSLIKDKLFIILNDNDMSISKPIGNLAVQLNKIRKLKLYQKTKSIVKHFLKSNRFTTPLYYLVSNFKNRIKKIFLGRNIFENLGLSYLGPVDGHDVLALLKVFKKAEKINNSVVIHVNTIKGKGFNLAEFDKKGNWHGVERFNLETVEVGEKSSGISWSQAMTNVVHSRMAINEKLVVITPAMIEGSKLGSIFNSYPLRSFDVGINEEYAFTFASGLALSNYQPFISIYSTFLQRSYDQVLHDNARFKNNIIVGVDRAGLVGQDGDTHHGIYDVAYLKSMPNTIIAMPSDQKELIKLFDLAIKQGMFFIRYPRGKVETREFDFKYLSVGKWDYVIFEKENQSTIIATGPIIHELAIKIKSLKLKVNLIYARFYHPLDTKLLANLDGNIFIYDIYSTNLGLYTSVATYFASLSKSIKLYDFSLPNKFFSHGKTEDLLKAANLDLESFIEAIKPKI
jgi:1-deoxy-D-xylulose-5-phosphate synthase